MQKEPAKRYPSAKELADDIDRFQSGRLVQAYEYRFSEHFRRFVKKHAAVLTTVAVALLALAALGVFSYMRVLHQREAAVTARNQAETERGKAVAAQNQAETEREKAVAARDEAERELYRTTILLADHAAAQGRLDECIGPPGGMS